MRRTTSRVVFALCLSALVAAMVGCSTSGVPGTGPTNGGVGPTGSAGSGGGPGATNYASVGERIYLTGVGADGQNIPRSAPAVSQGSLMMGGGGCGSCHGANGRGGTIRMMTGAAIKAPDVTYAALVKAGFTDATIRQAIRDGLDESGLPLKDAMPRWRMSDADVDATIAYLKKVGTP